MKSGTGWSKCDAWGHMPGTGPFLGVSGRSDGRTQPRSPAWATTARRRKPGSKAGDVIVKFGGKPVKDFAALQTFVNDSQPGDKVALEILRGDKTVTVQVVIGQRREEK